MSARPATSTWPATRGACTASWDWTTRSAAFRGSRSGPPPRRSRTCSPRQDSRSCAGGTGRTGRTVRASIFCARPPRHRLPSGRSRRPQPRRSSLLRARSTSRRSMPRPAISSASSSGRAHGRRVSRSAAATTAARTRSAKAGASSGSWSGAVSPTRARARLARGGCSVGLAGAARVEELVCIEARSESVDRARLLLQLYGLGHKAELHVADLEDDDLGGYGRFDGVFCAGVLYHLTRPWEIVAAWLRSPIACSSTRTSARPIISSWRATAGACMPSSDTTIR